MAVQGLSESCGLSGSPAEFPGQSGTPWESREVWESLGIGDQRSGQCMEETLVYGPESPVDTSRVPQRH